METLCYHEALERALKNLSTYDEENYKELWNFLYDWGNRLPTCVAKIQLILLNYDFDEDVQSLLESIEKTIDPLADDIKTALFNHAQCTSNPEQNMT